MRGNLESSKVQANHAELERFNMCFVFLSLAENSLIIRSVENVQAVSCDYKKPIFQRLYFVYYYFLNILFIKVREEEIMELEELACTSCPLRLKNGALATVPGKINCLIQVIIKLFRNRNR